MTAQTTDGHQFPTTSGRKRGYRIECVDALLTRVRATYEGRAVGEDVVRAYEIRQTAFPLVRRGYDPRYVDAALDRLEEVMFERERQAYIRDHGEAGWRNLLAELRDELLGRVGRSRHQRFRRRSILAHGYRRSQVDAVLDQLGEAIQAERGLRAADIRQLRFHPQRGGYCETQVDAFLDSIVEYILAKK